MKILGSVLLLSAVVIYALTVVAALSDGINWPAIAASDLLAFNWRSQFNFDFIIHLLLLAAWVTWREGCTPKGYLYGVLSVVLGGMFSFPYLVHAIYVASGDVEKLLMGRRANANLSGPTKA